MHVREDADMAILCANKQAVCIQPGDICQRGRLTQQWRPQAQIGMTGQLWAATRVGHYLLNLMPGPTLNPRRPTTGPLCFILMAWGSTFAGMARANLGLARCSQTHLNSGCG